VKPRKVDKSVMREGLVEAENRQTDLDKAMSGLVKLGQTINVKTLQNGLAKLSLDDEAVRSTLVGLLSRSVQSKLSLEDMVSTLESEAADHVSTVTTDVLAAVATAKGDRVVKSLAEESKIDVLPVIAPGKDGEDLAAFLESKKLLCLKPPPKIGGQVAEALAKGDSPDDVLSMVNKEVSAKIDVEFLIPVLMNHLLAAVFKDPKAANIGALEPLVGLLQRATMKDPLAETKILFATQGAWFAAKKPKGVIRDLFTRLHELGLVSVEAFDLWREDEVDKTKGKMQALIKVNAFVSALPREAEYDDEGDEDEGEEEEEDEFFQNPNADFFTK